MTEALLDGSAEAIAAAIASGDVSAREVVQAALDRIDARNASLGAFTDVTAARALKKAEAVDAARGKGEPLGPLAGAPFAVKNLFDVAGLPTRAGSKINRERPPAAQGRNPRGAPRSGGRRSPRRAQYGRIRLRLHRTERARRPVPQSARSLAHDRRLLGRLGRGCRGRAGAHRARLGHQRLYSRTEFLLRSLRPEADLRAALARRDLSLRREPRSRRADGPIGRRSGARL